MLENLDAGSKSPANHEIFLTQHSPLPLLPVEEIPTTERA